MNVKHTFMCPVCNETKTEVHNDQIDDAIFAKDFPQETRDNLVRVCESCYSMIKEEFSEEHDDTIH